MHAPWSCYWCGTTAKTLNEARYHKCKREVRLATDTNSLTAVLQRYGYALQLAHEQNPHGRQGTYQVITTTDRRVVHATDKNGFGLTLDEVKEWLLETCPVPRSIMNTRPL